MNITNNPQQFVIQEATLIKPFGTITSCRETVNGECDRGLTLEDCVKTCRDNPFCACGYYLESTNPSELSYCAPLLSAHLGNVSINNHIYPLSMDPTRTLWKRAVTFYSPNTYPVDDQVLIMNKDIIYLQFWPPSSDQPLYFSTDLTFHPTSKDALPLLCISKNPQFFEIANNIQQHSSFLFKVRDSSSILMVGDQQQQRVILSDYLDINGVTPSVMVFYIPQSQLSFLQYPVMIFQQPFQILTQNNQSFLTMDPSTRFLITQPFHDDDSVFLKQGHFTVQRIQEVPFMDTVKEFTEARVPFLQNNVLPSLPVFSFSSGTTLVLLGVALFLIIAALTVVIGTFYIHRKFS